MPSNTICAMNEIKIRSDRTVDSTDNNEFARDMRDETSIEADMLENLTLDERISDAFDKPHSGPRPLYEE